MTKSESVFKFYSPTYMQQPQKKKQENSNENLLKPKNTIIRKKELLQDNETPQQTEEMISEEDKLRMKRDSVAGAIFNLANSTIGAGVLGLPYVLSETGVIAGFLYIMLGATISCISLILLQKGL